MPSKIYYNVSKVRFEDVEEGWEGDKQQEYPKLFQHGYDLFVMQGQGQGKDHPRIGHAGPERE
jgi:hypothetical protein